MKAMILAAGRGERMGNATQKTPKPLTKIGQSTLIEHNLRRVKKAGIIDLVVNVSWLGDQITKYLKVLNLGLNITVINEGSNILGTGGGIKHALSVLGDDPFYLVNADVISDYDIDPYAILEPGKLGHLVLVKNPTHHPKGDFEIVGNVLGTGGDRRPYTFSGISLLSPNLLADCKDEVFPLEPVLEMAAQNGLLTGEVYNGIWLDVGTPDRLKEAKNIISSDSLALDSF